MQVFRAKDVERVLGMRRSALRMLVQDGLVTPARGPGRQYRFPFAISPGCVPRRHCSRPMSLHVESLSHCPFAMSTVCSRRHPASTCSISTSLRCRHQDALNDAGVLQILEGDPVAPADGYAVEEHEPDDIARLELGSPTSRRRA